MVKRISIKRKEKNNANEEAINKPLSDQYHSVGCIICGKDIVYADEAISRPCAICGKVFTTRVYCEDGHFVCDACHAASQSDVKWFLGYTEEKDPIKILFHVFEMENVHMHGPEHHSIVPGVLLVAYRNSGGEIDLDAALELAFERGSQVPGGFCGYWAHADQRSEPGFMRALCSTARPSKKRHGTYRRH